ncbi:tail fiber domain-containing protein [Flavobacterium wongokense]|uniref:tail fiber domain-containing protein n=1 Tax=Flavobacterium wongokense TaxID=2910674 RepID=UPI001F1D9602|nr:tail fiber domain-containing protein [Flavobacterium sp. WG47]MCF6131139.1 tail fiber domain-containing protein [Flavobacterium sp. WG47]
MKKFYLAIVLFCCQMIWAQVGINTTAPNAQLDIRSTNQASPTTTDGILIPKIDFFPSTPSAAQQGMIVYLTTLVSGNAPGFYYWDNPTLTWIAIASSLNSWGLKGNANTNPATNFLGTTDNIDLTFKRNNAKAGSIEFTNTAFGNFAANSSTSGTRNTAIGALSSFTANTATDNVAVGYNALSLNTGSENTAVGSNALQQSPGGFNSAFGFKALNANTAGSNNVAIGHSAMQLGSGGNFNSALGYSALNGNNSGNNNVAIGANSLFSNNASDNTAVGFNTMRNNSTGTGNVTVGYESMRNNTGSFNVALGHSAAFSNSSGTRNTALGTLSLFSNNGGSNNVAVGYNSLSGNTASETTAVGANALQHNSGGFNTAVGFNALNVNTGGSNNTAVGHGALQNSNANQNSAFGFNALNLNNNGTNNTAMGFNALASSSSATDNTAIGNSALVVNTSNYNTALGSNALIQNSGGQGNTAVGFFSMQGNTGGNFNTTLGYLSTVASSSLTNATAIGALATVGSSNSLVLGSVNGFNSSFSNTNVGIGVIAPLDRLHVVGNIRMVDGNQGAGKILTSDANGTASWANAPSSGWSLTGNSGIGSTNFIGTTNDADLIFKRFGTESGRITSLLTGNTFFGFQSGIAATGGNNTYIGGLAGNANTTGQENVMVGRLAGGSGASGSDNVFVGNAAGLINTANQNTFVGGFAGNGNMNGPNNTFVGYSSGDNTNGSGGQNTFIGAFSGTVNTAGVRNTLLGTNTNVTTNSLTNAGAIGADATVSTSNSLVLGSVNGVNSATATVNVGIGTTSPLDRLHVAGSIRMVDGTQGNGKVLTSNANGTGSWQTLSTNYWGLNGNASTNDPAVPTTYGTSTIGGAENWSGTTDANDYVLGTNNIERLRIKQTSGFVGIGTAAPSRKLHVFTGSSGGTPNGNADFVLESNGAVYQHFLAPSTNETGLLFGSNVSSIRGGVLYSNNTDILQFRAGGNTNRMIITGAGDVGIGNTPGGQFELSLDEGRKPGTTVWTLTSDARLKNVEGDFTMGLNEIRQLKPIRYHYKNVGQRIFEPKVLETEFSGFLAQDIQKVFPNCVTTDDDGYLSLNMHDVLIASINALKELDAKNKQLQEENEKLKVKLQQHDEQIAKILLELEKRN